MKRIRKLLSRSATGRSLLARVSSAPPSMTLPHSPPAPSVTTLTRPVSPLMPPALLAASPSQTAWTNLKEVLNAMRDGSDLCPPLKAALVEVTAVMDSIDHVGDINDEFVRITDNVKGFQGIFSQYGTENDISPAMRSSLDAATLELKLIAQGYRQYHPCKMQITWGAGPGTPYSLCILRMQSEYGVPGPAPHVICILQGWYCRYLAQAIGSKTERGRARRGLETPDDVDNIVIAFKRFCNVIDKFQLDMGLRTTNYYMNVHGGVGGAGGMSERGTGGNGGVGQGPTFNISTRHCTVNNLSIDALEKLGCVDAADIDAQSPEGCLKGTRVDLLNDLRAWSCDPNSPRIFWLDGMAGTGKSAIARSFCRMLREDKRLGGSFFCLRGNVNLGNLKRILPTLARHLASQNMTYKWALLAALDTGISWNANLEIQVEKLLEKPLHSAHGCGPPTLVLVIDALDELDDEDATKDLLQRLVTVVLRLPIKLFVTSRPEKHIRPPFETAADLRRVLRLHDIDENIVKDDMSLYLTNHLARIRAESSPVLPPGWASHLDIEVLTHRSGKLFIYAFTAMKYISENPRGRLQTLISIKVDTKAPLTKPLDDIYRRILLDAMDKDRLEREEIALTKRILATVLTVGQPVSIASLGGLLKEPTWRVRAMLDRLHAVIHVPADNDEGVVSTFHASFGDFLTTIGRASHEMLINPSATHAALFSDCIRVMDCELHFNVSNCPTSYLPNTDHELTIPALLQYVCLHWPHHIATASAAEASDVDVLITSSHLNSLQDVFLPKFLFWIEVLSAMNKASVLSSLIMREYQRLLHRPSTSFSLPANVWLQRAQGMKNAPFFPLTTAADRVELR
ncbi:hypothetical protein B0H11DRAFT_2228712 [Mycena galericulata]|nr:hypothetical protein B0H11DRAFT_2228712 [Mycena galericulata]